MSTAMRVTALAGDVVVRMDPATARDMAEAWATLHAPSPAREALRPRWFNDVTELHRGAVLADDQRGILPAPVMVPVLRLVGGESA